MNEFSYKFYVELIRMLTQTLPLLDFAEVKETSDRFLILRHDIEFSVEKAYAMARIEHEVLGINTSYFFQTRNYSYNPFSFKNMRLIKKIHAMGHKIGLHLNTSGMNKAIPMEEFIKSEVNFLQNGLELPIDRFSFHRPALKFLKAGIRINKLINAYDEKYFHLYEPHLRPQQLSKYYFSDSEHRWKYGNPMEQFTQEIKKLQLLTHPYSWSKKGLNNGDNFRALIKFKYQMMLKEINSECKNFPQELLAKEDDIPQK